jgi:hypothetical protein
MGRTVAAVEDVPAPVRVDDSETADLDARPKPGG